MVPLKTGGSEADIFDVLGRPSYSQGTILIGVLLAKMTNKNRTVLGMRCNTSAMNTEQTSDNSEEPESDGPQASGPASASPSPLERQIDQKLFRRNQPVDDEDSEEGLAVRLTLVQEKEKAHRENPINSKLALELVDLYLAEGRAYDAEQTLRSAAELNDNDESIYRRLDEVRNARSVQKVEAAKKLAEVDRTPRSRENVKRLQAEHVQLEIEILQGRTERTPNVPSNQYELGIQFKAAGRRREAIECFESVCDEPQLKAAALLKIGECFQLDDDFPKSLQAYRHAIEAAVETGKDNWHKLALYRAGVLASVLKMDPVAIQYFEELLKMESPYRDASKRLEELRRLGH